MFNPLDGAAFDLSSRTKLRIAGEDRERYLNGQATNDVAKASDTSAIAACVLNAKGRMDAHVFIRRAADAFILDADEELRLSLQMRLERYIISDDVTVEDVTDDWSIFHVIGAEPRIEASGVAATRFGVAATDFWIARSHAEQVLAALGTDVPFCDRACAEIFRIEQSVPAWGAELTPEILPPEANLESSCIDYGKGCYIGQEVISRMRMSGQTNKRLVGLFASDGALAAGMKLFAGEREVGWVTSATQSERAGGCIALAYVKRGANDMGTKLTGRMEPGSDVHTMIVDLPFRSAPN